ncbi:MAG: thermonuclease family protein [Myxococcota bacterium]
MDIKSVIKGDELEITRDGRVTRLRMLGIHAFSAVVDDPELKALELKAHDWLVSNVAEKRVRVVLGEVPQDKFGRYLAYVEESGTDINRQLVEEGRAVVYTEYPFEREAAYLASEKRAQNAKAGIWATGSAVKLVEGLRKQWKESRADPDFSDPLLTPAPDAVTSEDVAQR